MARVATRRDGDALVFGKESWRRPLERLSAGWVFKRRLPPEFGRRRVVVTPACGLQVLKFWRNPFPQDLLAAARILVEAGDVVWDVGANLGVFSVAAAARSRTGAVLAFEPDPWIASLLRETLSLPENAGLRIEIMETAIADEDGTAKLNINARSRAMNHLHGKSVWTGRRSSKTLVSVEMRCLDTMLASGKMAPPAIVKVDIEGAEHLLFRGATRLLEAVRPAWFVEVAASSGNRPEVSSVLARYGYRIFDGNALAEGLFERQAYDWLVLPEEGIEAWSHRIAAARATSLPI